MGGVPRVAGQLPIAIDPSGEFAVFLRNQPRQVARSVLLPPLLVVIVLMQFDFFLTFASVLQSNQVSFDCDQRGNLND